MSWGPSLLLRFTEGTTSEPIENGFCGCEMVAVWLLSTCPKSQVLATTRKRHVPMCAHPLWWKDVKRDPLVVESDATTGVKRPGDCRRFEGIRHAWHERIHPWKVRADVGFSMLSTKLNWICLISKIILLAPIKKSNPKHYHHEGAPKLPSWGNRLSTSLPDLRSMVSSLGRWQQTLCVVEQSNLPSFAAFVRESPWQVCEIFGIWNGSFQFYKMYKKGNWELEIANQAFLDTC